MHIQSTNLEAANKSILAIHDRLSALLICTTRQSILESSVMGDLIG